LDGGNQVLGSRESRAESKLNSFYIELRVENQMNLGPRGLFEGTEGC
jgi:hypothetical protein